MRPAVGFGGLSLLMALACSGVNTPPPDAAPDATLSDGEADADPVDKPIRVAVQSPLRLESGLSWTYAISRRTGGGPRIILIQTQKATTEALGTWTLSVGDKKGDRFQATLKRVPKNTEELPTTTEMELWEEQGQVFMDVGRGPEPALELVVPPNPVSAERVRCIVKALGGVVGMCSPAPGGVTGAPPLLEQGVVAKDTKDGAQAAQFLVGVVTAGIFIPGNASSVDRAKLTDFTDPNQRYVAQANGLQARYGAAKGGPGERMERALGGGPLVLEQAAGVLAELSFDEATDALLAAMPRFPVEQRYTLVRVGMHQSTFSDRKVRRIAKALEHLPKEHAEPQKVALLTFLEGEDRGVADAMLSGKCGFTVELFATVKSNFDVDEQAIALAQRRAPVLDDAIAVVSYISHNPTKVDVAKALIEAGAKDDPAPWVQALVPHINFDEHKMALMSAYQPALLALSESDRRALAAEITFDDEEVAALLQLK